MKPHSAAYCISAFSQTGSVALSSDSSQSPNPWLQALVKAEYVLSLNDGDSFSDIYSLQRFVYVSLRILALILGRRLVQLPQTIGPFQSESAVCHKSGFSPEVSGVYAR